MNIFLYFQKFKKNTRLIKAVGFLSVFVFSFLIFSHISIAADAGKHIGYQGMLLDSAGVAQTGTYTMDFKFYDALSAGTQQGSTITKSVTVANGYFSVDFSESDLSGIIFNQDLWMELTVSGTTLSPRSPVNSVPYSNVAFGVIYGSGAPALSNPSDGALYFDTVGNSLYVYDGSSWVTVGSGSGVSDHSDLTGLQGGNGVDEYYHLNFSNYSDLTDVNAQLGELTSVGSPSFASVTADVLQIADKIYFYTTNDAFVGFDENSFDGDEMLTIAASNDGSGDGAAIRLLSYNRDYEGGDINGLNLYAGTNGWISNFTNGIDRLDISPTGGVGINTRSYRGNYGDLPSGDKLTVFGNIGNIFDETRQGQDIVQLGTVFNSLDTIPPRAIAMKGSNLFVIDSANVRLYSLKIETDPNDDGQPTITGYVDFVTGNGNSIKIAGDYAYVGESNGYIEVFDISNPDVMLSVGSVQPTNFEYVNDIEINGRYLYALGYEQGSGDHYIRVIDITNPESPIEISSIAVPYLSNDLSISDNMMYVTNTDVNGINTYSLADPVNLSLINNQSFPSQPVKSIASGNYLYTISSSGYLDITDRRDTTLANYVFLTEFNLDSNGPYDIFISGRYAYIVTADGRLFVVDVKSSIKPSIVKNIELPFVATNVIVQGKKVVLAGGGSVAVFDAPGIETSNALVHSLQAGNVDIMNDLHIDGNVITNGALNVGNGGINSNGAVAIHDGLSVNGGIITNGTLNVGNGGILSNGDIGVDGNINLTTNVGSSLFIGLDFDENNSIVSDATLVIDAPGFVNIGTISEQINMGNLTTNTVFSLKTTTAVTIQGSATTCSIGNGTGTTSCTSDERLKQNVTDLDDDTLLKVLALRPVTFNWNSVSGYDQDPTHIGLIAQEVQDQFEDAVHTVYHNDTLNDDVLGVDYGYLVVPAIKAIQQQQALLGDIATLEGMTTLITDIQNENAHDPVAIINEKINTNKKFLTDFVVARVTAIRGYFDEIFAKKATLDEVCLKDADGISCYTRSQLDAVVNDINVPVQSNPIVDTTSDENTQDQPVDTTTVDTSPDSENTDTSVVSSSEETVNPPVDEAPVNSVPASEPTSEPEPTPTE